MAQRRITSHIGIDENRLARRPAAPCSFLLVLLGCGGMCSENYGQEPARESLAGEKAAEALKKSIAA